ncbi:MAG: RAQPRD family integrative conjugative element protein [Gammaproteobacteria bacterium]|nr:RAQPRD family integrative conjugative element protein [Gammaproteobacteria bacterium]
MAPMKRKYLSRWTPLVPLMLAGLILHASPAQAEDPAGLEAEMLARIVYELRALEPLIEKAESAAIPEARIRFRYDWLRRDLARVRAGLETHLEAAAEEPRTFAPLRGDYRR